MSDLIDSVFIGTFIWMIAVRPFWPWDWKGKRKVIKLNRRKNGWS